MGSCIIMCEAIVHSIQNRLLFQLTKFQGWATTKVKVIFIGYTKYRKVVFRFEQFLKSANNSHSGCCLTLRFYRYTEETILN